VLDESNDPPEGAEGRVVLVEGDVLDDAELARLNTLEQSETEFETGLDLTEHQFWEGLQSSGEA
jgi:hypothetical protein